MTRCGIARYLQHIAISIRNVDHLTLRAHDGTRYVRSSLLPDILAITLNIINRTANHELGLTYLMRVVLLETSSSSERRWQRAYGAVASLLRKEAQV